jgi:CheY-like chemotaxis protein
VILVAEDDEQMRFLVLKQLNKLGYEAQAVTNGLEAVESVTTASYKLILMDVSMPGLDGLEATKRIRKIEQAQNKAPTPIVALSGAAERATCLEAGMDDFVAKPVLTGNLHTIVMRWMKAGNAQGND